MKQVLLAILFGVVLSTNPGLKATIREDSMNYLVKQFMPKVRADISHLEIPEVHSGSLTIRNIRLLEFNINDPTVTILQNSLLQASVSSCYVKMHADWQYDPVKSDAEIKTTISLTTTIQIGVQDKKPSFSANVDVQVLDVDVHVNGGWILGDIINFIIQQFKGPIKDLVHDQIRNNLQQAVNDSIKRLVTGLDLNLETGSFGKFDFGFVSTSSVERNYITFGLLGQVTGKDGKVIPGEAAPMEDLSPAHPTSMIQLGLGDHVLNSALQAWMVSGQTALMINDSMIPKEVTALHLTTDFFRDWVPVLFDKFGSKQMRLMVMPETVPVVSTSMKNLNVTTANILRFQVVESETSIVDVFDIRLGVPLQGVINVKSEPSKTIVSGVIAQPSDNDLSITLKSSTVGDIDVPKVRRLISFVVRIVVVPLVNFSIASIPLPIVKGLTLRNAVVEHNDKHSRIDSDFEFVPQ